MGQAQINVRTRACSGTFIARTKQAALTHNVRGKELRLVLVRFKQLSITLKHEALRIVLVRFKQLSITLKHEALRLDLVRFKQLSITYNPQA